MSELENAVMGVFQPLYTRMGIDAPTVELLALDALQSEAGITIPFEYLNNLPDGSPLTQQGKRILLYLEDNHFPKVHIRRCFVLKKLHRPSRLVSKLPTADGFFMANGRQEHLGICYHCKRLEERAGTELANLSREQVYAVLVSQFAPRSFSGGSRVNQIELAAREAPSLETHEIAPLARSPKISKAIARLARTECKEQDEKLLALLGYQHALDFNIIRKIYRSKEATKEAIRHFDKKPWTDGKHLRSIPKDGKPLLYISSK